MRRRICATEMVVKDLIGRSFRVAYEANSVDQWRLFWDGKRANLITADYVSNTFLDMEGYDVKKYGTYNVYSEETSENLLAWMKDSNKWKEFVSGISGAKAVGGPTKDQFVGCWNEMNSQRISTSVEWAELDNPTRLFIPHENDWEGCGGYWLVSPVLKSKNQMYGVGYLNRMDNYNCRYPYNGVRPLISLTKDIALEYDEEMEMWLLV